MKLTLAEPKYLTEPISIIAELVNEVRFRLDKDKLELIAMDPANVAMIVFKLLSSAFTEYKLDGHQEICVSLDSLKQILRRVKSSDILTLELDKDKNRLKIQIKGESTRTFNLALIDIEEKEQRVPDLKFPLKIEANARIFNEAIEDMDIIAESVALVADKNNLIIESESSINNAKVEISTDEETTIKTDSKEPVRSKYSIEYLKKMMKTSKLADTVTLQFSNNYPLRIEYIVKDKLQLGFILAPRVSND